MTAQVHRLSAFGLTSRDAAALADFYQTAFDCRPRGVRRLEGRDFETLMAVEGGAREITLSLGREVIQLLEFDTPGRPYTEPLSPLDTAFQHFALVVSDIHAAWRRLESLGGWTPMSTGGPQRLPPSTGGVKAFKFRDPEGHPLEFLEFPEAGQPPYWTRESPGLFLGIDHSALSVRDVETSIEFYQRLGLRVAARSLNQGEEQRRLDGIADPQVDVIALEPRTAPPHVELLGYRTTVPRRAQTLVPNDLAATRLVMETARTHDRARGNGSLMRDPDGHLLELWAPD